MADIGLDVGRPLIVLTHDFVRSCNRILPTVPSVTDWTRLLSLDTHVQTLKYRPAAMEAMAPSSSSPVAISPLGIVVRSSRPVEAARMTSAFGKDGEGHWQEGEEGEYRGIAKLEAEVSKLRGELSRNNVDLENAKEKIIEVDTERKILMGLYSTASTELQNCREELAKVVKESVASGKQLKEKTKQLEEKKKQMKQSRDVLGAKEDGLVVRKEKEMCSSLQDLEEKLKRVEEESGRAAGDLVKAQLQASTSCCSISKKSKLWLVLLQFHH